MTRVVGLLRRSRPAPLLLLFGIGLLAFTWLMASGRGPSGSRVEASTQPDAIATGETRVVGFGHVDVEGGTIPLTSSVAGQIERIAVNEGDHVQAGEGLIILRDKHARAQLEEALAAVEQARVQLRQASRSAQNDALVRQLQDEAVRVAKTRYETGQREVKHLEELAGDDVVPNERLLAARDMLANLQSAVQAEELKRRQLELADPTDSQKIAESGLKLAEAKLQQAEDYLAKHTVSAPTDGIALRVNVSAGQVIGPAAGLPAIWFAPDKPRIVRAEIDQAFAHRVQPGQRAQLFDDRLEGEHWTGVVTRCGEWIAQRRSTLDEPFERNDVRTLECLIAIDAGQPEVRIGQRMRVVLVGPMESAAGTGELRP